jgi:tetratricopeptide (TPR) repeat protein
MWLAESKAESLSPIQVRTLLQEAQQYMEKENYQEAVSLYSRALDAKPRTLDQLVAYGKRGEAFLALGDYQKAIPDYSKFIELLNRFKTMNRHYPK